jgi:acyl-homoserine lactone acylase PvdQ
MFAVGFAHAEDRLWQMYFSYKIGSGELSEVLYNNIAFW